MGIMKMDWEELKDSFSSERQADYVSVNRLKISWAIPTWNTPLCRPHYRSSRDDSPVFDDSKEQGVVT